MSELDVEIEEKDPAYDWTDSELEFFKEDTEDRIEDDFDDEEEDSNHEEVEDPDLLCENDDTPASVKVDGTPMCEDCYEHYCDGFDFN